MTLQHVATPIRKKRETEASTENDERPLKIRPPRLEDGDAEAMWRLARESGVLEENAEYTYHMFSHFFRDACVIAEIDDNGPLDGKPVGFIAGLRTPDEPKKVFVWQIAVDHVARGRGVAASMLHELIQRLAPEVEYLEATVTPSNEASERTFRKVARELGVGCETSVLFPGHRFGGPSHEDEVLFRVGPFNWTSTEQTETEQTDSEQSQVTAGSRS